MHPGPMMTKNTQTQMEIHVTAFAAATAFTITLCTRTEHTANDILEHVF